MTQHDHSEHVDGCYRCDLSRDEAWTHDVINILRRHILYYCQTRDGDLPDEDALFVALMSGRYFMEWTIDAGGPRDWKLDQERGNLRALTLRYRGAIPDAHAAAEACNIELAETRQ